jgi:hypothetical protein
MRPPQQQAGSSTWQLLVGVAGCVTAMALTNGNPAVGTAPIAVTLLLLALWRLPMRGIAHAVLFIALLCDNSTERPGRNLYKSPLLIPGSALYETVSKTLHVPGLKTNGIETLMLGLALVVSLRMLFGHPVDGVNRRTAAVPMMQACLISMGSLLGLEFYGMIRGGKLTYSLLQMHTMFFMPFMTMFFAYAFKRRADIPILLTTYLTVAMLRALECIYYWATLFRGKVDGGGESGDGSYITTHSDSILAAVAIVICIVSIYQRPSLRHYLISLVVVPLVGIGVVLNNRRIAFVAVAMGFFFSYLAANASFRHRLHRTLSNLTPIALVYLVAGWGAQGGWAKPVQSLKSVIMQKDTSSATRDIENFNLLETMKQNPLIGSGFGHEYLEKVKAFDISKIFEAYRYVPHNSILWFWGVGGVVGFTLYWMFLVVGVFFAARLVRMAQTNRQAVMGMTALSAVIAWSSQCFGDMGLMSWMGSLVVASSLGLCASLAVQIGAYTVPPPVEVALSGGPEPLQKAPLIPPPLLAAVRPNRDAV